MSRTLFVLPGLLGIWAWDGAATAFKTGSVHEIPRVYVWHWRTKLPDRHGQQLIVLARGTMNSCLVEFLSDGFRVITSRNALRRAHWR